MDNRGAGVAAGVGPSAGESTPSSFKPGQKWVRFVVTGVPDVSPNGVQIDEIDVHDITKGSDDTWFFMGDSVTAFAFDRQTPTHQPSFAERVHEQRPEYFPAMINGGIGGDTSDDGARRVDQWLADCPDMKHWVLAYGTNDAAGNTRDTARFRRNIVSTCRSTACAAQVASPILGRIPFSSDGQHLTHIARFNDAIDQVSAANLHW